MWIKNKFIIISDFSITNIHSNFKILESKKKIGIEILAEIEKKHILLFHMFKNNQAINIYF